VEAPKLLHPLLNLLLLLLLRRLLLQRPLQLASQPREDLPCLGTTKTTTIPFSVEAPKQQGKLQVLLSLRQKQLPPARR
jgi:hypothetical protein